MNALLIAVLALSDVGVPQKDLAAAIQAARKPDDIAAAEGASKSLAKDIDLAGAGTISGKLSVPFAKRTVNGKPTFVFRDERAKKKKLAELGAEAEKAKARLRDAKFPVPKIHLNNGEKIPVGNCGELWAIVDRAPNACRLRIVQIVDATNARAELFTVHGFEQDVWVVMSTVGQVDDTQLIIRGRVWQLTGTKTYTTVTGATRTVPVWSLEKLD